MPTTSDVDPVSASDLPDEEFTVRTGRMVNQFGTLNQSLAVTNNGGTQHKFVSLECGFYLNGELVGTGMGMIANLFPGKTKHAAVYGLQIDRADKATCSVSNAF